MDIDIIRDRLTPKQIKFCILLVEQGDELSAKECAIQAGYSEKAAIQSASNLKQKPHIAEYIRELRNQEEKKYEVNLHRQDKWLDYILIEKKLCMVQLTNSVVKRLINYLLTWIKN